MPQLTSEKQPNNGAKSHFALIMISKPDTLSTRWTTLDHVSTPTVLSLQLSRSNRKTSAASGTEGTAIQLFWLLVDWPTTVRIWSQASFPFRSFSFQNEPHGDLFALAFGLARLLLIPSAQLKVCPLAGENVLQVGRHASKHDN